MQPLLRPRLRPLLHRLPRVTRQRRLLCSGAPRSQQPWALPFNISEAEAAAAFAEWQRTGHSYTTGLFALKSVRPRHLPFYVFEGRLTGSFTGVLSYRRTVRTTDTAGKSHSRRVTDYYERHDIPFRRPAPMGADEAKAMGVYAGFDFRSEYVEGALLEGLDEAALSRAVPLTAADAPLGAGVEAFAMKPSYAAARVHERLRRDATEEARHTLRSDAARELVYRRCRRNVWDRDLFGELFGGDVAQPSRDWTQPDGYDVESVQYTLAEPRLHDAGVVLLPAYVVEYSYSGEQYPN